ncbi:hypothetical protein PV328_011131 [Microctonus aethiopoides]|uniref:Uncharacterized protein n=1 Tax=Microctonus aethiopoides TaxID=144406 RepID=A0AA39C4E5_9HYME|nr:hypothetical protein PV328_011131 [Microctonus aethiopoides]
MAQPDTPITTVIIIALFNLINAMDDTSCVTNSDCSPGQYCYGLSQTCVDYTRCSRYNRQEGPKHAETPRHCGPCIDGYAAELLATGTRATICKKNLQQENKSFPNDTENSAWIYIASGIILCIIIIGSLACFAKNRITHHGSEKWFKKMAGWNFTPTAPPPDTGSYHLQTFFNDEPPIYSSVINNNTNAKDRNNLVSAVPFRPPDWIDLTQNYDVPDNSTDNAVMPTSHIENIDEETNPSTWVPEQMTVQIPARVFHQFAPEQRDNALNNVLNRSDCAVNTESTNDTNSPGPAGSSTTGNSRTGQNYRGPNVQINQMITLNMVNTDN